MKLNDIPKAVLFEGMLKNLYRKWANKLNRSGWIKEVTWTKKQILETKMKLDKAMDQAEAQKYKTKVKLLQARYTLSNRVLNYMEKAHKNDTWKKDDNVVWDMVAKVDDIDTKLENLK